MNLKTLILTCAAAATLAACSDIATDDRYIAVESVVPQRTVLLEDFTGQGCINCPAAHRVLESLSEQYGDNFIPVSIHAGDFGVAWDYTRYTGLMQPEGDIYNDAWGINEWPKGVVNRRGGATNPDAWAEAVRKAVAEEAPLNIDLKATCPGGEGDIAIEVTMQPTVDVSGNLQVWILEDGIVARQSDIDLGTIRDYVHNHVYRASVNGVGGEPISLTAHMHSTVSFTQPLRVTPTETWVPENLSVVAFVYNNDGVLQAAKAHVAL